MGKARACVIKGHGCKTIESIDSTSIYSFTAAITLMPTLSAAAAAYTSRAQQSAQACPFEHHLRQTFATNNQVQL